MQTPRALITGATGLIGQQLIQHFPQARILSRNPSSASRKLGSGVEAYAWRPTEEAPPAEALDDVDVVLNLAGEPVAEGRWSNQKKARIHESRIVGTRNLVAAMAKMEKRPSVLISASAVGYYGDRGDEELTEESQPGEGFLPQVCLDWEKEAMAAEEFGVRVVCIRIGLVLAAGGGALAKMLPPFKMGVGGPLGDGTQWTPWVHIDDLVGIILHAIKTDDMHGPVNAVAPNPVTNADFTRALGRALRRPALIPVPVMGLKLLFGEMAQILVASQRVSPKVASAHGYSFKFADIDPALAAAIGA